METSGHGIDREDRRPTGAPAPGPPDPDRASPPERTPGLADPGPAPPPEDERAERDEHATRVGAEPSAVDTHCHLFLMETDPAEAVEAARAAGVGRMICVGIDPATSRRSLELAESFRGVFASAGMHPHTAAEFDHEAGAAIEELLGHPLVVGVGETGLDYYRGLSPRQDQHRVFRAHVALSRETGKPLLVHVREAWEDALRILEEERAERVVLHCFSGDEATAREAAARGYHLSFAGNLTYPTADRLRASAATVDEGRLLLETDSPFLSPQARRGRPNAPGNVLAVAAALAELRGTDLDHIVDRTTRNALAAVPLLR